MSNLIEYENKSGYRIRATRRAYDLYYRRQGFYPVGKPENQRDGTPPEKTLVSEMKAAELRKYLADRGISFDPKAKREELVELAEQAEGGDGNEDPDTAIEEDWR